MSLRVSNAVVALFLTIAFPALTSFAAEGRRARDLGVPFEGQPGD